MAEDDFDISGILGTKGNSTVYEAISEDIGKSKPSELDEMLWNLQKEINKKKLDPYTLSETIFSSLEDKDVAQLGEQDVSNLVKAAFRISAIALQKNGNRESQSIQLKYRRGLSNSRFKVDIKGEPSENWKEYAESNYTEALIDAFRIKETREEGTPVYFSAEFVINGVIDDTYDNKLELGKDVELGFQYNLGEAMRLSMAEKKYEEIKDSIVKAIIKSYCKDLKKAYEIKEKGQPEELVSKANKIIFDIVQAIKDNQELFYEPWKKEVLADEGLLKYLEKHRTK